MVQQYISNIFGNGLPIFNRVAPAEIVLTDNARGSTFEFPTGTVIGEPMVLVYGAVAVTADQLTVSPGGKNVITTAQCTSLTITFVDNHNANKIDADPYYNWVPSFTLGYPRMINPFRMVMDKSLITVNTAGVVTVGNVALVYLLYFFQNDLINALRPYYNTTKEVQQAVAQYYAEI